MVADRLGDTALPFHLCHGDLAPWNAYQVRDRLFVFDWEYADHTALPGWDLLHLVFQSLWLLKRLSTYQVYEASMNKEANNHRLTEHLITLGVDELSLEPLALAYVLERLSFYAAEVPSDYHKLRHFATLVHLLMHEGVLPA